MIKISQKGLEEVRAFIKDLPRGVKIAAMRAATEYLIGDASHGLKHEPAYKWVTRQAAYGVSFFTDRQRAWFFANLDNLNVGQDNRTHEIQNAWTAKEANSDWNTVKIENSANGVDWVMGKGQARLPAKVGWRKWADVVASNLDGAIQRAQQAVNAWIKSKGY